MKLSRLACGALLVLLSVIIAGPTALAGEKLWVSDQLQLIMRAQPTQDGRVVGYVRTGEWADVQETNSDGWSRVRLADGKEGWLQKRYLLSERPAAMRLAEISPQASEMSAKLEALTAENQNLTQKVESLEAIKKALEEASQKLSSGGDKIAELVAENASLKQQVQQALRQAEQAEDRYAALTKDAGDVVGLQKERDELRQEAARQKAKLGELTLEVDSLRSAGSLKWFLAGAGVLIIGWLMGLSLHRRKRRQGLLD